MKKFIRSSCLKFDGKMEEILKYLKIFKITIEKKSFLSFINSLSKMLNLFETHGKDGFNISL